MAVKECCFVVVALMAATGVSAQNRIVNADFDQGPASYGIASHNGASFSIDAADGSDRTPSLRLTAVDGPDPLIQRVTVNQCVDLTVDPPQEPWDMGLRARVVSSDGTPASEFYAQFSDHACNVFPAEMLVLPFNPDGLVPGVQGDFTHYALTGVTDPMPGGNPSQAVYIIAGVIADGGDIAVNVDKFYFGPAGTTPVELTRFEVD